MSALFGSMSKASKLTRCVGGVASGAMLCASAPALAEPLEDEGELARREVQRALSSIPDRVIVQAETLIPAGSAFGWHVHPGEEVGYIIAGEVEMMVEGRESVVLRAGDGFVIPPRTPHDARDLGPETGRMLSTYILETGEPVVTFVEPPE